MIQTSENLIERQNVMSEKFKSLCVTLISLVTASIALNNLLLTGIALLFVGIIVIIISESWLISLAEYSKNKEGKFVVINAIEEKLPAKMFDIELIDHIVIGNMNFKSIFVETQKMIERTKKQQGC